MNANWLMQAGMEEEELDVEALLLKNEELVQSTIETFCDQMYNSVLRLPEGMREEFFYSIEKLKGPAYEGLLDRWKKGGTDIETVQSGC